MRRAEVECGNCGEGYSERCPVCPGCCDDVQYDSLDDGIRETVRLLRRHGFDTTDSGDGDTPQPYEKLSYGHVVVVVGPGELARAACEIGRLMEDHGLAVVPRAPSDPPEGHVTIEGSYSPAEGIALVIVSHVLDRMWAPGEENAS